MRHSPINILMIGITALISAVYTTEASAVTIVSDVPDSCCMLCRDCYRYTAGHWVPYSPPADIPRLLFKNFPEIYTDTAYTCSNCNIVFRCMFARKDRHYEEREITPLLSHHVDTGMVKWTSGQESSPTDTCDQSAWKSGRMCLREINRLMSQIAADRQVSISDGDILSVTYYIPDNETGTIARLLINDTPAR